MPDFRSLLRVVKVAATAYVALQIKNMTDEFHPKIEISDGNAKSTSIKKRFEVHIGPIEILNNSETIETPTKHHQQNLEPQYENIDFLYKNFQLHCDKLPDEEKQNCKSLLYNLVKYTQNTKIK